VDPSRVRQARLEQGLSLAQVAGTEVSRVFIHQVEKGQARPSRRVLALIARRTHKPISFFIPTNMSAFKTRLDLPAELSRAGAQIRRFIAETALTVPEREAMKLVQLTLRHGARLARSIESEAERPGT
jgi:transcriptional regulator with XRE-family HTH domain